MSRTPPATRAEFKHWRKAATRWADNDLYGHVNNTVYYQWFDSAVNAFLIESGVLDLQAEGPIALVVETGCTFFSPLAYPQQVEVGLAVARLGRSSMRYRLGIFAAGEEVAAAQGHFVHVLVDRATRRPLELPANWRAVLEGIAD